MFSLCLRGDEGFCYPVAVKVIDEKWIPACAGMTDRGVSFRWTLCATVVRVCNYGFANAKKIGKRGFGAARLDPSPDRATQAYEVRQMEVVR